MLSDADKHNHVKICNALLRMHTPTANRIIYSNEKMFIVEKKVNRQNDRIYSTSRAYINPAARKTRRAECSAKIMVWGTNSGSGKLKLTFAAQIRR